MWLFLMGHRTSRAQASEKQPDKGEEIIKEIAREIMDFIILNQSLGTKRLCLKPSTEIFETGKKAFTRRSCIPIYKIQIFCRRID